MTHDDLVKGENCFFSATGVTDGDVLARRPLRGRARRDHRVAGDAQPLGHRAADRLAPRPHQAARADGLPPADEAAASRRVARAAARPALAARRSAGCRAAPPIVIDGQRLEADVQLMLALRERAAASRCGTSTLTVERGRELTREEACRGRAARARCRSATVEDLTVAGLPARLLHAPPSRARSRCCSTSTAAASWSATSTPTTRPAACSAATPASTCSASSTARRPSTRSRPTSRTPAPRLGVRAGPSSSATSASPSAATARAATSRRRSRSSPTRVLALLIYPAVDATQRAPLARAVRRGLLPHRRADEWYTGHFMPEGADPTDPRRSPMLAPDLAGLGAGARDHRRLRPAARRGRGLRRRAARGRRPTCSRTASAASSTASSTPSAPARLRATRSSKSQG